MTCTEELDQLILKARAKGAQVEIDWERDTEGRLVHKTIRVAGLNGCGPFPMAPLSAAERLRLLVG